MIEFVNNRVAQSTCEKKLKYMSGYLVSVKAYNKIIYVEVSRLQALGVVATAQQTTTTVENAELLIQKWQQYDFKTQKKSSTSQSPNEKFSTCIGLGTTKIQRPLLLKSSPCTIVKALPK